MRLIPIVKAVIWSGLVGLASCSSTASPPTVDAGASPADAGHSDADAGGTLDDGGATKCPFPFPAVVTSQRGPNAIYEPCEAGCYKAQAAQLDATNNCVTGALLCFESDVGGGGLIDACYKNINDGRIVRAPRWVLDGRPGWVTCDPTDEQKLKMDACK